MSAFSRSSFIKISKAQLGEISDLYDLVKFLDRQALQDMGYQVEANKKKKLQLLKNQQHDGIEDSYDNSAVNDNRGASFEAHPELPYMGGKPSDQPIIPDYAVDAISDVDASLLSAEQQTKIAEKRKRKQEKQRAELANRPAAKFKISGPKQQPTLRPVDRPRSAPPKLRPPGS
jgi:hypothetical protein